MVAVFQVSSMVVTGGDLLWDVTMTSFSFSRHTCFAQVHIALRQQFRWHDFYSADHVACDGIVRRNLCVGNWLLIAISYEGEVNLSVALATVEGDEVTRTLSELRTHNDEVMRAIIFENTLTIAIACPVPKAPMVSVAMFFGVYMTFRSPLTTLVPSGCTFAVFSSSNIQK